MSQVNCSACNDLRDYASEFVTNGVTKKVATSLKNNTGLNPNLTTLHNDCDDLNDANDCLIGRMDQEIEAYEACDCKEYMHKLLPNLYELLKAIIASICGLWKNVEKHECEISNLYSGFRLHFKETEDTSTSHVIAGKGVSFLTRSADDKISTDIYLRYEGGALLSGGGGLSFFSTDFVDVDGKQREGNPAWAEVGDTADGNELIYEIRLKKSEYPEITAIGSGLGQEANAGGFHVYFAVANEGTYASGQHGGCNPETGEPLSSGNDRGHLVPEGWYYLQLRMSYIWRLIPTGATRADVTPRYFASIRFSRDKINC